MKKEERFMNMSQAAPTGAAIGAVNARIDRLPTWCPGASAKWIFVIAYFFAFYDIIAIGAVLPNVTKAFHLAPAEVALPLTTSLFGYIVGALLFGRMADRYGRRPMLAATLALLAVSSVLCGMSWGLSSLATFRFLNGMGIGAQITLTATLINEFSPAHQRARNIQLNIIAAGCGDAAAPFVAMALLSFGPIGWRLVLGFGVLAFIPLLSLARLPESPRWLAANGRVKEAEAIVAQMEERLSAQGHGLPAIAPSVNASEAEEMAHVGMRDLLRRPWIGRVMVVTLYWVLLYVTTYGFLGFETVLLDKLAVHKPHGLLYTALGDLAFPIGAALPLLLINRIPRRFLLALSSLVYALGLAVLAMNNGSTAVVAGAFIVALVILVNSGVGYTYTSEIFPTRLRASAMGLADGVGHLGGIVAPYLVLASLSMWGARGAFAFLAGLMVVCAVLIAGLGVRGAAEARLDEGVGEPA
ncbi:MFS transporter [Solirhodobacter olei]|uniref:MFS transporter n=1 Tax=Solirhodobacter olei TaxID=2493082 RepID=UPI000FD77C40|nr:MFS transporter [Solirhodobacter olei]